MKRYSKEEILDTIRMLDIHNLDIRTVTLGLNLRACAGRDLEGTKERIRAKITEKAKDLAAKAKGLQAKYGVPIVNKRIAVTPVSLILGPLMTGDKEKDRKSAVEIAKTLDETAKSLGIDFIGGYTALCYKDMTYEDRVLIESLPEALSGTERVCASIVLATTKSGLNMEATMLMAEMIKETAGKTKNGIGCAKLVVFANAPEDNPFMAGAFHGTGEGDATLNVGVSGPGVVKAAIAAGKHDDTLNEMAETIKKSAFKITRAGQLIGKELAAELGVRFGIVDLSLAPTMKQGDSVAEILEEMGIGTCGGCGTTAALAMLVDAVKKGGLMAAENVGGLSGAFIPVSEDHGMLKAVEKGALTLEKLEAMTAVCSVGIDMVVIPGDTPAEVIAGLIADELMIGVVNNKTTAVRVIPAPGKKQGELVDYGGLLGKARVMRINTENPSGFVRKKGRIPAPMRALTN